MQCKDGEEGGRKAGGKHIAHREDSPSLRGNRATEAGNSALAPHSIKLVSVEITTIHTGLNMYQLLSKHLYNVC